MRLLPPLVAALLLLLPGATRAALAQPTPQEVTVGFLQGEPDSLDPNRTRFAFVDEAAVIRQVFEPLLRFDEKLTPQPAAAESFDVSADGTVVTFHLRRDGRWSDGQPVTAGQFEYSWKRLLDPALNAAYAAFFVDAGITGADEYNAGRVPSPDNVGVRALDDYTLEIRLNQPFGALADLAALWVASPLRPDIVAANPDGWATDPSTYIGNGPFAMTDWVHGDHITLSPNSQYMEHANWPRPTLTRATLVMTTNPAADYAAFASNARDWTRVPEADVNQVLNDPNLAAQSRQYAELTTYWVNVNTARAPLSNVTLRRALATAIDRKALIRDIAGGIGLPMTSIIPPGMPGFQESLGQELGFDAAAAKKLLAQAGFSPTANGQTLPSLAFDFPATLANQRRAEYLQAQWKQNLGVDIRLTPMDPAAYQQALSARNYDLAFGGWAADYPDPQDWLNPVFGCTGSYNTVNYCNPDFDQLVARADAATTPNERLPLYNAAQARLIDETPVVPLFALGHLVLVKPWVRSTDGGPLPITALDEYPGSFFLDRVQILPH
ncbi:MAG TPA: peptide ABC transporter substrate-binding protein [Chloroflexota bacterium]|nr:peptide ABC transporter substrate-binding protein [Chloroflexota bacterium]